MSQKWFLLKCISLVFAAPAFAQLPPLLKAVEDHYSQAGTITAQFVQVNDNVALAQKKTSSGKILIKRPLKIRWETVKPDHNLLVSDGKHFWFYTPPFEEGERGQVIERDASKVQSQLANALLAGSFSAKTTRVEQKGASSFLLIPKAGTAGTVVKALVEVDETRKLVKKVSLDHQGGNHSEITLSEIELGSPLKDELFVFHAPPGTDWVRGE